MTNYLKHTLYSAIAGLAMLAGTQAQAGNNAPVPTVVLDPGHGMANRSSGVYDPGCVYAGVQEASVNLDLSKRVEKILKQKGIKVVMTREDAVKSTPLTSRTKYANNADLFVSVHCNAANGSAQGIEAFAKSSEQQMLARYVYARTLKSLIINEEDFSQRGYRVKNADFAVLKGKTPSVLVEAGFLDNAVDRAYLTTNPDVVAKGIADGVLAFLNKYGANFHEQKVEPKKIGPTFKAPAPKSPVPAPKSPAPIYNNDDQTLLAKMLFGEGRSCSIEEKIAMAFTAINRVNDGDKNNGETLREVLLKPNQYKCFEVTGDAKAAMDNPQLYEPDSWSQCQTVAKNVLGGKLKDPTNGATFFVGKKSNPDWLNNLTQVFVNNAVHKFYRDDRQSKT